MYFQSTSEKLRKTRPGKEGEEEKKISLPSAHYLALGKAGVCRVPDVGHSTNPLTGPTHAQ